MLRKIDWIYGGIRSRLMKGKAILGLNQNMEKISDNLWVGGINNPQTIISQGFKAVLDLREHKNEKYRRILGEKSIDYLSVKIPDRFGISPEILFKIVLWLEEKNSNDLKTLIHCNLGRGRAPLVASAYFVLKGLTPEAAISELKKKRSVTYLNNKQRQALQDFKVYISKK